MLKQAVILAAGRGSRLGVITRNRTKAMLPILGKPIMIRVMDRIREAGIRRFVVVMGSQEGELAAYLNSSWYPNIEVKYVLQPNPIGTADALMMAQKYIDSDFLLTSIDNLASPEHIPALIRHFNQNGADFVLSLVNATSDEIKASADVIINGGQVVDIMEKPTSPRGDKAAFMLYACSQDFLKYLPNVPTSQRGERELVSAVRELLAKGGRVDYVVAKYRLHLTNDRDFLEFNNRYLDEGRDSHILSETPPHVVIHPPVRIDAGVQVGDGAEIGPYVYLEAGSTIGEGACLSNTIVLRNTVVAKGEVCRDVIAMRDRRIAVG
ncbi:MAG: NTP transferase domain-containing protein [Anaerolineales bacterium]|nr:NTP transferase domain-containing protein [Anaerolineales bacterium]